MEIFCVRRLGVAAKLFLKDQRATKNAATVSKTNSTKATADCFPSAARVTSAPGSHDANANTLAGPLLLIK